MGKWNLIKKGVELARSEGVEALDGYVSRLRESEPLVAEVLEVYKLQQLNLGYQCVRRAKKLLPKVSGDPELLLALSSTVGIAYRGMGELDLAETWLMKAEEIASRLGNEEELFSNRAQLLVISFLKADYGALYPQLEDFVSKHPRESTRFLKYLLAVLETVMGRPKRALDILDELEGEAGFFLRAGVIEMRGLALRLMGKLREARESFVDAARKFLEMGSPYAAFPCAKALQLHRFGDLPPPESSLLEKCEKLGKEGPPGERAAAEEVRALLGDDAEAAKGLLAAAKGYLAAHQNVEATFASLAAARLGWIAEVEEFVGASKLVGRLIPTFPGLRLDPLLGDFLGRLEALVVESRPEERGEIRAYLLGGLRVFVGEREITSEPWGRRKALPALVYLLLAPGHRLPAERLFYLLWPDALYDQRGKKWLYDVISTLRARLGRPSLLRKVHDFYQLEGVWTDLDELENQLRAAQMAQTSLDRQRALRRARELIKGELLPEFPYDDYVEEYRRYYARLVERLEALEGQQ